MAKPTRRAPSPAPTVTLDPKPKQELKRSSSEESIRVLHHAVLFPSSPHTGRVTYIRRIFETDAELIKRQQAMIATQPLTYAEELKARRKDLEIRKERRKQEKAAAGEGISGGRTPEIPEITIAPASGKSTITPSPAASPTKTRALDREAKNVGANSSSNNMKLKKKLTPPKATRASILLQQARNKSKTAINNKIGPEEQTL